MNMNEEAAKRYRNYGFWNEAEQEAIDHAHVAIAGVGGDGFQLGLKLAQMGVRSFSIADPEVFEPENTNRVPGAVESTYGHNKAEVFRDRVMDIAPESNVAVFTEGVQEHSVEDFMHDATLVLDESELTHMQIGTMVARQAVAQGIPDMLVMNVGFAAQVTSFHPESKYTFERFMGIPQGAPLDEIKDMEVDFARCIPYLPPYLDLQTFKEVMEGAPLPSIAPGVDIASAIGSSQAFLHMTQGANNHRPDPVWAPRIAYMDALTHQSHVTRYPRASHYRYLAQAVLKNTLGLYPRAAYTAEQREARANP